MRGLTLFVAFTTALLLAGAVTHYGLWRWLVRTFPAWTGRWRRPILAALALLYLLPLSRAGARLCPFSLWPAIPALGMLWHLVVCVVVVPLYALRAAGWGATAAARALRARRSAEQAREPLGEARTEALGRRELLEGVAGVGLLGTSSSLLARGYARWRFDIVVEDVVLRLAKLPRQLEGFTLVQLSDLHAGVFFDERAVAAALDKAALLRPDLVVVTGDLVDFDPRFVPVVARQLERMRAREGVAAVLGNHDYYVGAARVVDGLRAAGVRMLVNESMLVAAGDGGGFLLAGVDDLSARRTGQGVGPRLERATRRPDAPSGAGPALDRAIVLLCHQPRYFDVAAGRVDAQLSGHTHGGQIGVGAWPARLLFEYVAGRYERSGSVLWVNRGIGVAGPPARVGAPAEITRIVLTS